jgi:N-acylneuraminate cytidylyltransferase/CMP-N,N'-diacetyllegionaminic acid synthase
VYRDLPVLCLIPARGGSKGVPGKNSKPLLGRPLIAWTVAAAQESAFVDDIVVSTDDAAIAAAAAAAGARVPFQRPADLASDEARMTDVIEHALVTLAAGSDSYGWLLLLQPTSPLRTAAHIDAAFARLGESRGRAIVSVCEAEHSPLWIGRLPADGNMASFCDAAAARSNRQQSGPYYRLNGSIYLADVSYWRAQQGFLGPETFALVMPHDVSVDIDEPLDFQLAECLLRRRLATS